MKEKKKTNYKSQVIKRYQGKKITSVRLKTQAIVQMKTGYTKQTYKILQRSYTRKTGIITMSGKKSWDP